MPWFSANYKFYFKSQVNIYSSWIIKFKNVFYKNLSKGLNVEKTIDKCLVPHIDFKEVADYSQLWFKRQNSVKFVTYL